MRSTGSGAARAMAGSEWRARVGSGVVCAGLGFGCPLVRTATAARCTVSLEKNVLHGLSGRCCACVLLQGIGSQSHGRRGVTASGSDSERRTPSDRVVRSKYAHRGEGGGEQQLRGPPMHKCFSAVESLATTRPPTESLATRTTRPPKVWEHTTRKIGGPADCCSPPPPLRWAPSFERTTRSDGVRLSLSDPLAVTPLRPCD